MSKPKPVSRSGRFSGGPGDDVVQFTESISFDRRLWKHDIQGSIAHATMLQSIGVLTKKELAAIKRGLKEIGNEIAADSFPWRDELEDVHMNIEGELTARIPAGAKLHTARSRNDQIALDSRMWLRDEIAELTESHAADLEWQRGDLALLDNHRVQHGRRPFGGRRQILVAFGARAPTTPLTPPRPLTPVAPVPASEATTTSAVGYGERPT